MMMGRLLGFSRGEVVVLLWDSGVVGFMFRLYYLLGFLSAKVGSSYSYWFFGYIFIAVAFFFVEVPGRFF